MNKSILFVDDEKPILRSIIRLFNLSDYNVFSADNGDYALEILKNNKIDMIVSDMRMPQMHGYELLDKVKTTYPKVARLILSGYADENLIITALQNNSASAYIFKPWINDEMVNTICNILTVQDMIKCNVNSRLSNELENIGKKLITFNKLRTQIKDDNNTKNIIKIIRQDIDFEKNILNVVNSAFVDKSIDSLEKVIENFGVHNFQDICLFNNLLDYVCRTESKQSVFKYICTVNLFVGLIYTKVLKRKVPNMYESIGLLHNLGRIMETSCSETNTSEIHYNKIGEYLCNYLDLPYVFLEANLFNCNPMDKKVINKEVMAILRIAIKYTKKILYEEEIETIDSELFRLLHISPQKCNTLLTESINRAF